MKHIYPSHWMHKPAPAFGMFCLGMVFLIATLTAYSLVADDPERRVVMSVAEFNARILAERRAAALLAFEAARQDGECFRGLQT